MTTITTIFYLVLGTGGGSAGLAVIPTPYATLVICEAAGEDARRANQGLASLSYTCVPAFPEAKP